VGDAAHAITPSLTQGAGLALEDAVVLGAVMRTAVPGEDLAARLDEFTRQRRDRVVRVDRAARRLDRVVQAQSRLAVAARDALLARLATRLVDPAAAAPHEFLSPVPSV
jgi:2-polyprenyl-6-methoxyphenol hydroxylase-like FAD-dependent oxidoreductase